jgi:uncharacterized protein (DUF305 family)
MQKQLSYLIGGALLLVLSACGQPAMVDQNSAAGSPAADHGHAATMESDAPFDAQFIDSMIEHHQGAIDMAETALEESQRPEIRTLAQNIIDTQQQEIEQMQSWREQWYPDVEETGGLHMDMGAMELTGDTNRPFEQRFIEAMIEHHQGAIDMAREAQTRAEHAEVRQLAEEIIQAQQTEIQMMEQWQRQWFGQ